MCSGEELVTAREVEGRGSPCAQLSVVCKEKRFVKVGKSE